MDRRKRERELHVALVRVEGEGVVDVVLGSKVCCSEVGVAAILRDRVSVLEDMLLLFDPGAMIQVLKTRIIAMIAEKIKRSKSRYTR